MRPGPAPASCTSTAPTIGGCCPDGCVLLRRSQGQCLLRQAISFRRPRPGRRARCGARRSAAAQLGAQQPRRLVGAESELALQLQRRGIRRWNGSPSDRPPEPSGQRQLGVVHDRAGRDRGLLAAAGAIPVHALVCSAHALLQPQPGQAKPAGQRAANRYSRTRLIREVLLELDQEREDRAASPRVIMFVILYIINPIPHLQHFAAPMRGISLRRIDAHRVSVTSVLTLCKFSWPTKMPVAQVGLKIKAKGSQVARVRS